MDRRAGARARPEAVGARWVALVGTVGAQRARTVAAGAAIEQEIGVVVVDGDGSAFTPRLDSRPDALAHRVHSTSSTILSFHLLKCHDWQS